MNLQSIVERRGAVPFPAFTGERVYMRPFTKHHLPFDLERWTPTVDAMLAGIDVAGPMYLMIDQAEVRAGETQRRPGVHIDGYWIPTLNAHGGGGHGGHRIGLWDNQPTWSHCSFEEPEAILLASDVAASQAFEGSFDSTPGHGGDFSHLDVSELRPVLLGRNHVYAGNVTMLHESLPVPADARRTLVRINVPGWSPQ